MNDTIISGLVNELERIAKKNRDEFRYRIGIRPIRDGSLEFSFVCEEKADGHVFLTGYGGTVTAAVEDARSGIPHALKEWEYKS